MNVHKNMSTLLLLHSIYFAIPLVNCEANYHIGRFEFSEFTYTGQDVANEFQMILPRNIKFASYKLQEQSNYQFVSIAPLKISNDEVVSVQFHSETPDSKSDWIGAYSPADVDITTTVPVKYGYCGEDLLYKTSGTGLLTFNFTNLRNDIAFYYFIGGNKFPVAVQKSTEFVSFINPNQPVRPRIVPNDMSTDTTVFKVQWSSFDSTTPVLKWGIVPGEYIIIKPAETSTITRDQMCGSPARTIGWRDPGLIHTALIELKSLSAVSLLSANMKIYYTVGDESTKDMTEEYSFFVPSMPGKQPMERPTTLILYDDMGRGSTDMTYTWNEYGRPAIGTAYSVAALVQQGGVDAVFHGGDISYAVGYSAVWEFFLDMISPITRSVLYLSIVGNHEIDFPKTESYYAGMDSGGECGVQTLTYLPEPYPATIHQPWWSYDIGLIHIVGMSTEHDFTTNSAQWNWIENDLKNVDRKLTPWIVFGGHRPMYINSDYDGDKSSDIEVMDLLIKHIEPLFFKYRVNLGVYGHNHVMQRHSAVFNKTVVQESRPVLIHVDEEVTASIGKHDTTKISTNYTIHYQDDPQATVHMVIGTAGAAFSKNAYPPSSPLAPLWNELYFYQYGYAVVEAVNASYLSWEFIESATGTNQILDRMVITQSTDDFSQPWVLPTTTTAPTKTPTTNNSNDSGNNNNSNHPHPVFGNMLSIILLGTILIFSLMFIFILIASIRKYLRSNNTVYREATRRMGNNISIDMNSSNSNDNINGNKSAMTHPLMMKETLIQNDDTNETNNSKNNFLYNPLPHSDHP